MSLGPEEKGLAPDFFFLRTRKGQIVQISITSCSKFKIEHGNNHWKGIEH
jgi:hypothetical protein